MMNMHLKLTLSILLLALPQLSLGDAKRGEIVMAYITLAPGFEPSDELANAIQEFVKHQTAPYKYPRRIEFRETLPKTISGKIRRVELREQARNN